MFESGNKTECRSCGQSVMHIAEKVGVWGMFDCHLFHKFQNASPEQIIGQWRKINAEPYPAIVGGDKVDDLRPLYLCPVILSTENGKELRRVGSMVFKDTPEEVATWLEAVQSDPDISRLLQNANAHNLENAGFHL